MKLSVDGSFFRFTLFLTAVLAVSGCSGGNSIPASTNGNAPASTGAAAFSMSIRHGNDAVTIFGANACANPKFPTVCVQQGQDATLGIEETCGKSRAACGKVKWSTKTSNKGLSAYFQPNPGNPTNEIVMASIRMKVGRYSQTIKIVCSRDKQCVKYPLKATIYVQKYTGGKH